MSIFVIVFLSCLVEKENLSCEIDYSKKSYKTREICESEGQLYLIKGECVELKRDQTVCTRLFEPTREFWNMENQTRIKNLIKENEVLFEKTVALEGYKAEFEKYLKAYHFEIETIRKLQAENAKLRACIEWYADRKNCDNADFSHVEIDDSGEEIADGGYRARQCLKELEK